MRMIVCTAALLGALLTGPEAQAQSAPASPAVRRSDRALALSQRFLDLTQPAAQSAAMLEIVAPPAGDPDLAEMRGEYLRTMRDTQAQMREAMVAGYARIYTEAELEALLAFYGSPVGRSITGKGPEVAGVVRDAMGRLLDERQARKCAADPGGFGCRRHAPPAPARSAG